jgi:phytoene dehydrogenase-like protein
MSQTYDVVIAGAGHNGLTVGCYLAKAGLNVCMVERQSMVGGGVMSAELIAPGYVTDVCSTMHHIAQYSPTIKDDELGLLSKYGLKYLYPEVQMCVHFLDGTYLSICKSLDDTCASIAKFSQKDAEAYRKFNKWAESSMKMIVQGMFTPPPPYGIFASMMDSSEEGRELLRTMQMSPYEVLGEYFENEKVRIGLMRWISEIMVTPQTKGLGLMVFVMIGLGHQAPGIGMPIGGSGKLSQCMEALIKDHGGTIMVDSPVKSFKIEGGKCKGVVLESGEEILAKKLVVSNLHVKNIFPDMVQGATLPENFARNVQRLKPAEYSCFQQSYALNEAPKYKADAPDLQKAFIVEFAPNTEKECLAWFDGLKYGARPPHFPLVGNQSVHDPSRAPAGKHTVYFYEYAPFRLADGGLEKWDEIREQHADESLEFLRQHTTNMGPENINGRWIMSPADLIRRNPAFVDGDFAHLAAYVEQNLGNRPLPRWNYKTPVDGLWMCGPSTHPGSGCSCGGRAAVHVILEELGMDIEDVIKK